MGGFTRSAGAARSLRIAIAFLCVLLVAVFGVVQVAHSHPGGADPHANCSLCATAHVTVHLTQALAPAPTARVVVRLEMRPPAELPSGLWTFSYFSRPPPALNLPA